MTCFRWSCTILMLALALFAGCATNPSEKLLKDFPELRAADGSKGKLAWSKFDGFDYLVFYGTLPGDSSAGAGIYQGGDPQFRPSAKLKAVPGKLGVFSVDWYDLPDKGAKFYRTCVFDYQKAVLKRGQKKVTYATKRHVWAYADTEEAMNAIIAEIDKMRMFAVRPPDIVE